MENLEKVLSEINGMVWSAPLFILLLGAGIYLTFLLKGVQFRYLGYAIKQVFAKEKKDSVGDISHFEALMTSLAGAIGTGTIVGVATGVAIGGLGSLFWMWVTAFVGMATKYTESLLAVKFRSIDQRGEMSGGPMYYIEKGLGWRWLALTFSLFASVAAIGTGNLVQVNSMAEAVNNIWNVSPWITGLLISGLTSLVILGGVKSIGHVAGVLVPFMALLYFTGGVLILGIHYDKIIEALILIVQSAFSGQAAVGGFTGATVAVAMQMGVSKSVFSNEAGLGISSVAAAAARTDSPSRQALITMTGALVSTIIMCSITGLALAVTGVIGKIDASGKTLNGASLTIEAFNSTLYGGGYIVTIGLLLFAFTTVIAWAYYGEKCFEYLFGEKYVKLYRIIYALLIIPGAALKLEIVWHLADITNGLMAIPNLIGLIGLSKVVVSETQIFLNKYGNTKICTAN